MIKELFLDIYFRKRYVQAEAKNCFIDFFNKLVKWN